jgi:chaperonin GroES
MNPQVGGWTNSHPKNKNYVNDLEQKMGIRPLYDRVLIERIEEETVTSGGLFIPQTASTEKPLVGRIIAVGQGRLGDDGEVRPLVVSVGDQVAFGRYAGVEVKVDGDDLLVLKEDEILGIMSA